MALVASMSFPAPAAAGVAAAAAMLALLLGLELLLSDMLAAEGTADIQQMTQQMTGGVISLDTDLNMLFMLEPIRRHMLAPRHGALWLCSARFHSAQEGVLTPLLP
jgi:hypothetical protein